MQAKQSNTASGMYSCLGTQTANLAPPISLFPLADYPLAERPALLSDASLQLPFLRDSSEYGEVSGREGLLHDARNLIGAIGLYADLLSLPGVLSAEHREYADELRHIGSRSEALVERLLLGFTSSASERPIDTSAGSAAPTAVPAQASAATSIRPAPATLREVLEGCSGVLGRVTGGRPLELTFGPAAGVPITASREDVERILVNLVRNAAAALSRRRSSAVEAGHTGSTSTIRIMRPSSRVEDANPAAIRIEAGLLPRTARGSEPALTTVQLSIEDSGCGMAPDELERVLHSSGPAKQGKGIGLRVVRELTSASNTELRISSALNIGTRIEMDFPIQLALDARNLESVSPGLPDLAAAGRRMA